MDRRSETLAIRATGLIILGGLGFVILIGLMAKGSGQFTLIAVAVLPFLSATFLLGGLVTASLATLADVPAPTTTQAGR